MSRAGADNACRRQVAELQQQGVSLIVVQGGRHPDRDARQARRCQWSSPSAAIRSSAGIVQSLARPGGNATGMTFMSVELNPKRIDLLRTVLPACRKIGLAIQRPPLWRGERDRGLSAHRRRRGIELSVWRSQSPADIQPVVAQALDVGAQALVMLPSCAHGPAGRRRHVNQCLARNVPVVSGWASIARAGALLTYGPNQQAAFGATRLSTSCACWAAQRPPACRSSNRRPSSWSSTARPPMRSGSPFRPACWRRPTRSSNEASSFSCRCMRIDAAPRCCGPCSAAHAAHRLSDSGRSRSRSRLLLPQGHSRPRLRRGSHHPERDPRRRRC